MKNTLVRIRLARMVWSTLLVMSFVAGYTWGYLRAQRFTDFYRQTRNLREHFLTASLLGEGKREEAYDYVRSMVSIYCRNVDNSQLLGERFLIPQMVMQAQGIEFIWQVDPSTKTQVTEACRATK
jgi:hypothetical protein